MASISSPGIGSGLDINSIISQLMAVESRPLLDLDTKEAGLQADISGLGALKGVLSNLKDSLGSLKDGEVFDGLNISSSNEEVFTATVTDEAVEGSFDVHVNRLAQRHKLGSDEFAGGAVVGGNALDALTLTVGSESFSIDLSTAKDLETIRDEIMGSANETGVTANIITGDGGLQSLVMTAGESGFDQRVQSSFGGTLNAASFGFQTINTDPDGVVIGSDAELDAALVVDGISVTRGSNTITDVMEGVTLSLQSEGSAQGSVALDNAGVSAVLSTFVSNVNQAVSEIKQQSGLSGNSLLRNIDLRIRQVLNDAVSEAGQFSYLASIGVTTNEDNTLSLDSSKLTEALQTNRDSVKALFSDSSHGIGIRMDGMLEGFVKSSGVVESIVESMNNQVSSIDTQRDRLNIRLESTERRLRSQFTSLDTLLAGLNTTSSFLSQQLTSIANILNRNEN